MATKKSSSASSSVGYVTTPLEDRLRTIERRLARIESHRLWQKSWLHNACISFAIYIGSCMMLLTLLIPGWYIQALYPVASFWLYVLAVTLAQTYWKTTQQNRRN